MRERGLKFALGGLVRAGGLVAPHAGAWIEIPDSSPACRMGRVAPHAGAWIEIRDTPTLQNSAKCRSPCGSVD